MNIGIKKYVEGRKKENRISQVLIATVNIYPKDKSGFCITNQNGVGIRLIANGENPAHSWEPYSARLSVFDADDYDIEKYYQFNKDNYKEKIHELINWLKDMENAVISDCTEPLNDDFFPDI